MTTELPSDGTEDAASPVVSRRTVLLGAGALGMAPMLPSGWLPRVQTTAGRNGLPYDYPVALDPPFAHGVASGDPLADRVIFWTRLTLRNPRRREPVQVAWRAATDRRMRNVVARGRVRTDAHRDWTVKVDAVLPEAATTYYYQFSALGTRSVVGRTRTAPAGAVDEVRIAVVACSSFWSAHFNAYGRLADRDDLDLVVHCGDHIYDFVDEDEWVRARNGFDPEDVDFRDWRDIGEVRRRYALYYADPDFCRLHQQHPMSIVWDNHDIDPGYDDPGGRAPYDGPVPSQDDVLRVFWEWTPTRPPCADGTGAFPPPPGRRQQVDPEDRRFVYRSLPYGALADLVFIDTRFIGKQPSSVPIEERRLLGDQQYAWLADTMSASAEAGHRWRFVVNGWPLGQLQLPAGQRFYGAWDDYPFERDRVLGHLRAEGIGDNVVVTGDAHGNFAWDLVEDAALAEYDAVTGEGSVGVEFAPSSVGRGGADELIAGSAYRSAHGGEPPFEDRAGYEPLLPGAREATVGLEEALAAANPTLRYVQWRDHGYGIVHLTPDAAVLEHWWQPILQASSDEELGAQHRVAQGSNHVERVISPVATAGRRTSKPAPEPLHHRRDREGPTRAAQDGTALSG